MSHPCSGHACDHCYLCDVVGICCASVSVEVRARLMADAQRPGYQLGLAIAAEAGGTISLRTLVRAEAQQRSLGEPLRRSRGLALPPGTTEPLPINSAKEVQHVPVPRPGR
jgi:hypothetical protein